MAATKSMWMRRWVILLVGLGALGFAASTPDKSKAELVAKYASADSKFLDLKSGAHVHYRDQGRRDAPLLVLLHGSNSSLHTWEAWVKLLSNDFRIVSFDLPGHGLTGPVPGDGYSPDDMASFVDEVRRALSLEHFCLAGNSMGGHIAWRYTLAHPQQVDKLVLVDASGLNQLLPEAQQPKIPIGFRMQRTPGLSLITQFVTPPSLIEKSVRSVFVDQSKVTPAIVQRYADLLLYPGNRRTARLRATASFDMRAVDRLGQIKAPTLILSGQKDVLVPVQAARLFHARIPGSKIIEYPNVNHVPMEEIPERSSADVRAFLLASRP